MLHICAIVTYKWAFFTLPITFPDKLKREVLLFDPIIFRDLPYEASSEEAMKHDEVVKRVEESINHLRNVTEGFMDAIVGSVDQIP